MVNDIDFEVDRLNTDLTTVRVENLDNLDASVGDLNTYVTVFLAKSSEVATALQIDTQLSGTHGSGAWGAGSGTGAISYTPPRITDPSHNPIDGVQVWVTTDVDGVNIQASGYTNALGYLSTPFMLDAGTYYLWLQRGGYEFINPETVVVS